MAASELTIGGGVGGGVGGLYNVCTLEAIAGVQLGARGASLHWEALDVSFSLTGLLAGIFGTRAWMQEVGRRGGSTKSAAKAAAARANGKQGGRPAAPIKLPKQESPALLP